ncbi:patatin-like phospholipase family protein [Intrasporangium sp. YIM S08009]|uniref:patatin-like phospholipase family protein n=1 Tax=Intrasporangium zincisolvens TaxID=3080018 RepID=UPI002B054EFA|nr:patatin-like phospholipase family protein [Intrasporangium sp. YIM S08009]
MATAFVLTGGGSLGAVQVGMLAALHESGIRPDLLVGTSVGAVNAAYVAGAASPDASSLGARVSSLARLWQDLHRRDVFRLEPHRWWDAARGSQPSMFSGDGLAQLLHRHLGYDTLEEAHIPVAVTVTDLVTGIGSLLYQGPSADAVRASAAIPGVLPPVHLQGSTFVDGAIGELDVLTRTAAHDVTDLYLLPGGYPCAGSPPTSALGIALTSLSLLLHRGLIGQVRAYTGAARLHIIPPLCPLATSPADFTQTSALVHRAHRSTRAWLHGRGDDRAFTGDPSVLALHTHDRRPVTEP